MGLDLESESWLLTSVKLDSADWKNLWRFVLMCAGLIWLYFFKIPATFNTTIVILIY